MIGLDTNLLVRIFAGDDARQADRVARLIDAEGQAEPVFVNVVVLVEFAWTMRKAYRWEASRVLAALRKITEHANVVVEDRDAVREAIVRCLNEGADFPDQLIAVRNSDRGCRTTMTFDRDAAGAPGFTLLVS
jgi:predicted nucleic-acid-binding protein